MMEMTTRRREVAELLCWGLTREQIGMKLGISPHTVRVHSDALRKILGVSTARQIPWAYQRRIINASPTSATTANGFSKKDADE